MLVPLLLLFGRGAMVQQQRRPATCTASTQCATQQIVPMTLFQIFGMCHMPKDPKVWPFPNPFVAWRFFQYFAIPCDKAGEPQPTAQGRGLRLGSQPPGRQISRSERHGNTMDCFHLLWQEQCGSTSEKTTFSGPA